MTQADKKKLQELTAHHIEVIQEIFGSEVVWTKSGNLRKFDKGHELRVKMLKNAITYYTKAYDLHDKGAIGKLIDVLVRDYANVQTTARDYVCRPQGMNDFQIKANERMISVEIKSGAGDHCADYNPYHADGIRQIFKGKMLAFCPEYDSKMPIEKQTFMFTCDEWHDMLEEYGAKWYKNPKLDALRGTYTVALNTWQTSKTKSEYIFDKCYEQPTLEQWLKEARA